jgi:hypothetical protein
MFIKTNLLQKLTFNARIQDIHGGPQHGSQQSQWYSFHTREAHSIESSSDPSDRKPTVPQ